MVEEMELNLLLSAMADGYGFDYRNYARPSLVRRLRAFLHGAGLSTYSGLQDLVLHDRTAMRRLVETIAVHTTGMFRDPDFFGALRRNVIPILRTYPFVRIWHAGCSTGEEVHSLAILLEEEGLYDRTRIYATDLSDGVLDRARRGVYSLRAMREFSAAYREAGGRASLADYFVADSENAVMRQSLRRHIIFSQHNLTCDRAFNEFQLVLCRNVTIYFNEVLRARVHSLIYESLERRGFLGLGKKETIRFTPHEADYETLDASTRLFRKIR